MLISIGPVLLDVYGSRSFLFQIKGRFGVHYSPALGWTFDDW